MNGAKLWKPIVDALLPVYGSVLVAGGAPRDYVIHKSIQPRDVDIFVPAENEFEFETTLPNLPDDFMRMRIMEPNPFNEPTYRMEGEGGNIVGVMEGRFLPRHGTATKINIIGKDPEKIADPQLLMADFDHSLCQFWANPNNLDEVFRTEAAKLTLTTGVVEVFKPEARTDRRLDDLTQNRAKSYNRFTWERSKSEQKFDFAGYKAAYDAILNPPMGAAGQAQIVGQMPPAMGVRAGQPVAFNEWVFVDNELWNAARG
jgi:hypothetical protein